MAGSLKKILLISDDKSNDAFINNLLQNQEGINFEINRVCSVEKAIGEINQKNYDSIILDIGTDENCLAAAERICSINSFVPIIVLTHSKNGKTSHRVMDNVQQIIRKDYLDSDIITQTILTAINRKKIENEIQMRDAILQAVNNAAEIFLTQPDWSSYLNEVLASWEKQPNRTEFMYFQIPLPMMVHWSVNLKPSGSIKMSRL